MVIDFSKLNLKERPTLILKNLDDTAIQTLGYAFNIKAELSYNEISTLTFDLPSRVESINTPHYSEVVGMRIVELKDVGQFLLIDPEETSDGIRKIKSCKAYSLEYEFAKKKITLENGTYNFWNPLLPDDTIVGRILEKLPDWSVGYIDENLIGKYRTFDITEDKIYNFIKTSVQESYSCIFDFDTYNRKINVISASESTDDPKPVYISSERLLKEIKISEDSDSIVTCLDVSGADGVSIRSVNPTGTNKIYNLDYFMNETNFDTEFIDKWRAWESSCEQQRTIYFNTTMDYNIQIARLTTEQAALSDLNGELTSLENVQATVIQGISEGLKTQRDLNSVNSDIREKKSQITEKRNLINQIKDTLENLLDSLSNVNSILSLDRYFTERELIILQKYFIEDSLQDESFVAASATTYENEDISNSINSIELSLDNGSITSTVSGSNKRLYSIEGGTLSISSMSANMVKAIVELNNDDNTFVLTSYLNKGTLGEASFSSGCVTTTGTYRIITNNSRHLSFMIYDGMLYFTKNTTDYEQHAIEQELYEYGVQVLNEKAEPTYTFSIESGNFLSIDDFVSFKNELSLGKQLYLKLDDDQPITPYVIAISIDFENLSSFSMEFSSSYTSSDRKFRLAKLLEQSVSMGKTLNSKSGMYAEFVNSGASTAVKSFMDSALNVAKNTVLSSGNSAIEIGDSGIRVRKWADTTHSAFSDEQIWIVDNVIAFTTDNWVTSNMAIGKIFDENIVNSDGSKGGTAYGIAAPYLVGTMIAGKNLIIDTENGAFKVDENGVYINSLKFYVTHGGDKYDTTLEGELTALKNASDQIVSDMNDAITELNEDISRTVTTYYQNTMPTDAHEGDLWYSTGTSYVYINRNVEEGDSLKGIDYNRNLQPICNVEEIVLRLSDGTSYTSMADGSLVDNHNDIIYSNGIWTDMSLGFASLYGSGYPTATTVNTSNPFYTSILGVCKTKFDVGKLFRFNGSAWNEITDADIIVAIQNAATAQATADGKIISSYKNYAPSNPTEGDLWYNTADSKTITRCIEVGDNLSGATLLFDTNTIINSINDYEDIIIGTNGHIASEPDGIVELFSANEITSNSLNSAGVAVWLATKSSSGTYSRPTWIYTGYEWDLEVLTVPSTFGTVTDINKDSPFYSLITATFTNDYEPKKLYRYDGHNWVLVEDGAIEKLETSVNDIGDTLSKIITTEGYLNARKLSGVIDSAVTQMQSAKGNVLFDADGIWLLNNTTKNTATKAVWMNEKGMVFGTGNQSQDPSTDDSWTWTTAINHEGIMAEALAGKVLSGCQIRGGYLNINDNFIVTEDGEVTAKKGIFKGTIQASDFKDSNGQSMMSNYKFNPEYLSLYGLEIKNKDSDETTLLIDTDGNITLRGNINLGNGSVIDWSVVNDNGAYAKANSALSNANTATNNIAKLADGTYMNGTFISGKAISSPTIYGGTITGATLQTSENGKKIKINSTGLWSNDSEGQTEGWCVVPDNYYGGLLEYYVNSTKCYAFGTGISGSGYSNTDMVLKAITSNRGRFVVDVTNSGYKEVKFIGLSEDGNTKFIYANDQILATQNWVNNDSSVIARFG